MLKALIAINRPLIIHQFFINRSSWCGFPLIYLVMSGKIIIFAAGNKKLLTMCTINMTFEVPETRHINIEALKKQMHSYLEFILSMPSIEEKAEEKKYDMSFFDRFDNDWSDDPRDSHEIAAELHDARVNGRPEIGAW